MKRTTTVATALMMTAGLALPAGSALAATHSTATTRATAHKYRGSLVDMRWGTVQVTITVKGKKITNVKAALPTGKPRSEFINRQAGPLLKSEVLEAQSANIDEVSGATDTSEAYIESLQHAIKKAKLPVAK
jgi:uncharacterized protein with FMN-binding domain